MQADRQPPICRACFSEEVLEPSYSWRKSFYDLYQCEKCEVQFWWPQITIGGEWYEKNPSYIIRDQITYDVLSWGQRLFLSKAVKTVGLRLLDIGCGSGAFLYEAEKLGYEVTGIDYDRKAVETARTNYHLKNVHASDLTELCKDNIREQFDVVTMWSILEHTVNPGEVLQMVIQLVRPGGLLFIEVPNRTTIAPDAPPPQHWFRWDMSSLERLLEIHGNSVVESKEKTLDLQDLIVITSAHLRLTYAWYWLFKRRLNASAENMLNNLHIEQDLTMDLLYKGARTLKNMSFGFFLAIPLIACRVFRKKGTALFLCSLKG